MYYLYFTSLTVYEFGKLLLKTPVLLSRSILHHHGNGVTMTTGMQLHPVAYHVLRACPLLHSKRKVVCKALPVCRGVSVGWLLQATGEGEPEAGRCLTHWTSLWVWHVFNFQRKHLSVNKSWIWHSGRSNKLSVITHTINSSTVYIHSPLFSSKFSMHLMLYLQNRIGCSESHSGRLESTVILSQYIAAREANGECWGAAAS